MKTANAEGGGNPEKCIYYLVILDFSYNDHVYKIRLIIFDNVVSLRVKYTLFFVREYFSFTVIYRIPVAIIITFEFAKSAETNFTRRKFLTCLIFASQTDVTLFV